MKTLIVGSGGQLGWELSRTAPDGVEVQGVDFPDIDIADAVSVERVVSGARPDVIINSAAYTQVDTAESEPDKARAVNCTGAGNLARAAQAAGAKLVHISTDFVFSGEKGSPYQPSDIPDPRSVYGSTKFAGEKAVAEILGDETLIIRTAWLYSSHGSNFVHTMIRLMGEREKLTVIDDQIGTPCWAKGLALCVWACAEKDLTGLFHWTDAGVASWYDFAVAIQEEARALGLLERAIPVTPIPTSAYPTPAARPAYSVLDKRTTWEQTGLTPCHWRGQLRRMLSEVSH